MLLLSVVSLRSNRSTSNGSYNQNKRRRSSNSEHLVINDEEYVIVRAGAAVTVNQGPD